MSVPAVKKLLSLPVLNEPGRRPAGPVELDPAYPENEFLYGEWLFTEQAGTALNATEGSYIEEGSHTGCVWNGDRITLNNAGSDSITLVNDAADFPDSEITIVFRYRKTDTTKRQNYTLTFDSDSPQTKRCSVHLPWTNGFIYFDFGGTADGTSRVSWNGWSSPDTAWHTWALSVGPRGMELWQDGEVKASHGNSATRTSTSGDSWGNGIIAAGSDLSEFEFIKVYSKQLTKESIMRVCEDPYGNLRSANERNFIQPVAAGGALNINADFFDSTTTVYDPTVSGGAADIAADFFDSLTIVYDPTLSSGAEIQADYFDSVTTVYDPTVSGGPADISADYFDSTTVVYDPTLVAGLVINADFFDSTTVVYDPTLVPGAATISADYFDSATSIYDPTLQIPGATQAITAAYFDSTTVIFNPTLTGDATVWIDVADQTTVWTDISDTSTTWTDS